jgi:hypothetical protein
MCCEMIYTIGTKTHVYTIVVNCWSEHSFQGNVTTMSPGTDQKPVLHLHHLVTHAIAQSGSTALSEKERCAQTKLHPCKVQPDADTRTTTERHVHRFLLSRKE